MKRANFFLFLMLCCLCIFITTPAAAHANLIDGNPSPNSTLSDAPETLTLNFTEPLEPAFVRLRLYDSTGASLALGAIQVSSQTPATATTAFPPDLPHGLYTVSFRVISAADGHATEGAYTFSIGVPLTSTTTVTPIAAVSPVAVGVRWVNLMSLAVLIGALGFSLWVSDCVPRRWFAVGWVAAGVGGVAILINQAATAADVSVLDVQVWAAIGRLLSGTAFAGAWLSRTVAWGVIGILLWRGTGRRSRVGAFVLCLVMVYAHTLTSHAAARLDHPEAVLLDSLHVLASSIWIGGLFAFGIALWNQRNTDTSTLEASVLTLRFSNLARWCVLVLALTGLYSAWLHVGSLAPLPLTSYGRALTVKSVLFAAMLGLAAINLFFTSPALKKGQHAWREILHGLIGMELLLAGGILIGSAWMTSDMPAGEAYRLQQAADIPVPVSTNFFEMREVDDRMLHLDIMPGTVGENTFSLSLYNADGSPLTDASRVSLRFTHLDNLVGESTLQVAPVGDGVYTAVGSNLSVPGQWRVRLSIRQPGQFDVVTDFEVSVP